MKGKAGSQNFMVSVVIGRREGSPAADEGVGGTEIRAAARWQKPFYSNISADSSTGKDGGPADPGTGGCPFSRRRPSRANFRIACPAPGGPFDGSMNGRRLTLADIAR